MGYQLEPLAGQRQNGESNRAVQACNDFLRMGPGRSVTALMGKYQETPENSTTQSLYTLQKWATEYKWFDRAAEYDKSVEDAKNLRAKEIMHSGLSLDYERVEELKQLANQLKQQLIERGFWLSDVKQIGSGQFAERIDIERFNQALIEEIRGVLDDLARETGGRANKHQISGENGGDINIRIIREEKHG